MLSHRNTADATQWRSLAVWALFCAVAGALFLLYALSSLAAGRGVFVMPLDDVYIHFQYARQIAAGQPYVYNPGQPPSSGATSFLYPYILAGGYLLGFQELNLGLWAMMVGALALVSATWLVYRLVRLFGAPDWLAVVMALAFEVSGPVAWHFLSGMETGLVVLFTLGTLYAVLKIFIPSSEDGSHRHDLRLFVVIATLLTLIRPEGGILAVLAVGAAALSLWVRKSETHSRTRRSVSLLIPVLAVGAQPAVNLLLTGSAVASGNAAKSIFGIVPFSWGEVIRRVLENFGRTWAEFTTGISPREGMYLAPVVGLLALVGLASLLRRRKWRLAGILILAWLVSGTLAIATLDTAFWHFKRYQMPFLALLFPLAGWGIATLTPRPPQGEGEENNPHSPAPSLRSGEGETNNVQYIAARRIIVYIVLVIVAVGAVWTGAQFWRYYLLNGDYVYLQPLQMARWLQANTPPDAVVAVHDTGMMRYRGGRTTIDMVGLTTPGAADYWRNGPGAVAEFLIQKRPDYIAAYGPGHGFGLGMLADTDIYGKPLASFPVDIDNSANVALAAGFQGIYKPNWAAADAAKVPSIAAQSRFLKDFELSDTLNVANLDSEKAHNYQWNPVTPLEGFPTEVHQLDYLGCAQRCLVVDGGRIIYREESFKIQVQAGRDVMLVSRVQAAGAAKLQVFASAREAGGRETGNKPIERWIPSLPGHWFDVVTLIPAEQVAADFLAVRMVADVPDGSYQSYAHWAYQGSYTPEMFSGAPLATFQNGAIQVAKANMQYQPDSRQLNIKLDWYTPGNAQGDYKLFVHVLDEKGEIVGQADTYPGGGTLPPGNWLPGVLHDQIVVDLGQAKPGRYRVVMGLYNPYTFERMEPTGGDDQQRLTIGEITLP